MEVVILFEFIQLSLECQSTTIKSNTKYGPVFVMIIDRHVTVYTLLKLLYIWETMNFFEYIDTQKNHYYS